MSVAKCHAAYGANGRCDIPAATSAILGFDFACDLAPALRVDDDSHYGLRVSTRLHLVGKETSAKSLARRALPTPSGGSCILALIISTSLVFCRVSTVFYTDVQIRDFGNTRFPVWRLFCESLKKESLLQRSHNPKRWSGRETTMSTARQRQKLDSTPSGVISTKLEEKLVQDRVAIGAPVVYETIRREGEDELQRPAAALAWSGLAAGLSMGASFIAEALLTAHLPREPWVPLVSRFGYSLGFLIVVLGRQQLFTENTLTVILPLMVRKDVATLARVLRLWAVVLTANLVGTFLFAACIGRIALFDSSVYGALTEIGAAHLGVGFWLVFVKAIFAGWLIALMVWLLPGAESARVSIIIILTYVVGIGAFNHIVAGSTTVFFMVVAHSVSMLTYCRQFFLPTLLGNIVGGVALVAALGHAQVVGGKNTI